jgi:hypothetical protein
MAQARSFSIPAAIIASILLAWVGSVANSNVNISHIKTQPKNSNTSVLSDQSELPTPGNCTMSQEFPASILQWCSIIMKYSASNSLPVNLIGAVMLQESGGYPEAYSASGAVGLLQIMPSNGLAAEFQCPNGPCFENRPTINQLLDPEFNISYGTSMLSNLVNKYGNLRDALLHYGPTGIGYDYADIVLAIWGNHQ